MNWEALGALSELLGAAAVVLTLLYLSRQIAHQNRALETTTRDSVFRQLQEYNFVVMGDERLGGLFQRGVAEVDPEGAGAPTGKGAEELLIPVSRECSMPLWTWGNPASGHMTSPSHTHSAESLSRSI